MSNRTNVFAARLNDWQKLVDNLKPHLAEMPNLAADHATLTGLIDQTLALQGQQDVHLASLRDVVSQRNELAKQARKARNRLAAGLQSAFDHESDKLIEFGVKPRARRSSLRLTPLEKAENAAARAAAKAAALAAKKQPADGPAPPPTASK
jgi:septal ring factor EnvC (AmiA/AmiB activator)